MNIKLTSIILILATGTANGAWDSWDGPKRLKPRPVITYTPDANTQMLDLEFRINQRLDEIELRLDKIESEKLYQDYERIIKDR